MSDRALESMMRVNHQLLEKEGHREVFFVDGNVGQSGDGRNWDSAFKTIMEGVNAARRTEGTEDINSDKFRNKYVYIWPGQYNEKPLFSGYNIHVIGVMPMLGNVDYGVVINYDGASDSSCAFGFTGAGIELANLQINCTEAIPALWVPSPGDGCWIHGLKIKGDGTNCTYGIHWPNFKSSVIEDCYIEGAGTGIEITGGADCYFIASSIRNNLISGNGAVGIHVGSAITASADMGSEIFRNRIIGNPTIGIHQEAAGAHILIADNHIKASTAVTDAASYSSDNHTAS